jgi:polyribonucleotide nucleotidyltransferase
VLPRPLAISPVPVAATVGAVRIGMLNGDFVVNPPEEDHAARPRPDRGRHRRGYPDGQPAEGVTEAQILDASTSPTARSRRSPPIDEFAAKIGEEKMVVETKSIDEGLLADVRSSHGQALVDAIAPKASSSATKRSTRSRTRSSPSTHRDRGRRADKARKSESRPL